MMIRLSEIMDYDVEAKDGTLGYLRDILVDESCWRLRYLVVDPYKFLPLGRRVLISYQSLDKPKPGEEWLPVSLTKEQIRHSPPLDSDKPVSLQYEEMLSDYYGYTYYWMSPGLPGTAPVMAPFDHSRPTAASEIEKSNPLRSFMETSNYQVESPDSVLGKMEDLEVDATNWQIVNLIINCENSSISGVEKISIPVEEINEIRFSDSKVVINDCSALAKQINSESKFAARN